MARDSGNHGNGFFLNDGIVEADVTGRPLVSDFEGAAEAIKRNEEGTFLSHLATLDRATVTKQTSEGATLLHLICKSTLSDKAFFALLNKQPEGFRCEFKGSDQAATAFLNGRVDWQLAIKLREKKPTLTFQI